MDADKIKAFFVLHCEKIALGLIIAVSGYLIYAGLGKPNFLAEHQPDRLTQDANSVKLRIDDDHSEEVLKERTEKIDVFARTQKLYTAVDASTYKVEAPWDGSRSESSIVRRQDPMLAPALDLRTVGVLGTIAAGGGRTEDGYAIAGLEDADEVEKEEVKRRPKRRSRRNAGMESMEMEMMGMDMEMEMGMGMEMEMGGSTGEASANRRLDTKYNFGYSPSGGGTKNFPRPVMGWFIAGTALLPHREIYEAYELALKDADSYDPARDTPLYYDFEVQRADVTGRSVDELKEEDWEDAYDRIQYTKIADQAWDGFAPEIVPKDYRDENLTTWIPPMLLDNYAYFATHPKIPMLSKAELEMIELERENATSDEGTFSIDDLENQLNNGTELAGPSSRSMGGGMDMDMDMMDDMDMSMDMMDMGGMMMFGRGQIEKDPVEHKLIRFYDFGYYPARIKPGRSYVYRIRYAVIDPNFPADQRMQPKQSSLSPEVAQRVSLKVEATRQSGKRDQFRMWSDWSVPSEPAMLPTRNEYFAGSVQPSPASNWEIDGRPVEYRRDPPEATIVATQFETNFNTRVPMMIKEVKEGHALTKTAEFVDIIDPITRKIKKAPDYQLQSRAMVIDLGGADPLSIAEDLTSPGTMLLYDSNGKLIVTDDIEDQLKFRIYSYADEREGTE